MDEQLIEAVARLLVQKASPTSPLVTNPHGPNALFNTPGLGRSVVNAIVQPLPGLYGTLERMGHVAVPANDGAELK
jgi:hypothetical protein